MTDSLRLDRLNAQAGSSMISTRSTFASMDESEFDQPVEELKLNIILKVLLSLGNQLLCDCV